MVTIFIEYFYWHFGVAPFEIFKIMKNYQIAVWHKFLIARHFQTLFSPWHRQNASDFWSRKKTFVDKISNVVIDTYIRLIAAGLRLTLILSGLIFEALVFVGFMLIFIAWLAWPALAIYLVFKGASFIL